MAGAEQIEPGFRVGEPFAQAAVRQDFDLLALLIAAGPGEDRPLKAPIRRLMRLRDERAGALGGGERRQILGVARIEGLDQPMHAAAAALRKIRPERHRSPQRRAAAGRQRPERGAQRVPFEGAAADRAVEGAGRTHDHARAALARARSLRP